LQVSEAALLDHRRTTELREQFIAVLGHDLRNPVAAIDAGARLLHRKVPANREVLSIIDLIHSSVVRMSELIDNVLDFARGRLSGGVPVELNLQRVEPILQQVVDEMHAAWPNRAIETHFALHDEVACDRGRLAQLFSNLLGNALLHGAAAGAVHVTATTDGKVLSSRLPIPAIQFRPRPWNISSSRSIAPSETDPAGARARALHRVGNSQVAWWDPGSTVAGARDALHLPDADPMTARCSILQRKWILQPWTSGSNDRPLDHSFTSGPRRHREAALP
jgi:hypothetical protein